MFLKTFHPLNKFKKAPSFLFHLITCFFIFNIFSYAQSDERLPQLKKGINLSRLYSLYPRVIDGRGFYVWPPLTKERSLFTDDEHQRLIDLGFDHIRLPIDPGPLLEASLDERRLLLNDLLDSIEKLHSYGLAVIVDLHPSTYASHWKPEDILQDFNHPKFILYEKLVLQLAQVLKAFPFHLTAFEIMNEPQKSCQKDKGIDWLVFQERLYTKIRHITQKLPLILTGGCWSSIDGLKNFDPSSFDKHVFYNIHFYEPHSLTHQGLPWSYKPVRWIMGMHYPAEITKLPQTLSMTYNYIEKLPHKEPAPDDAFFEASKLISRYYIHKKPDRAFIEGRFNVLQKWQQHYQLSPSQILIGEFGAIKLPPDVVDNGSRYRWLKDVRLAAENRSFGWSFWDYNEGFGLLESNKSRQLNPHLMKALNLTKPKENLDKNNIKPFVNK